MRYDKTDSIHCVLHSDEDNWGEREETIYSELVDFFYASFKDSDCAASSALLADHIINVEAEGAFYVAFSADSAYLIKESNYRSYYALASLFETVDVSDLRIGEFDFLEPPSLIESAQKSWFKGLAHQLDENMEQFVSGVTCPIDINSDFDEIVHGFLGSDEAAVLFAYPMNLVLFKQ